MKDFKSGFSGVRQAAEQAGICEVGDNDDLVHAKLVKHLCPDATAVVSEVVSGDGEDEIEE